MSLISVTPRAVNEKLPFGGARCSGERTFPPEPSLSSLLASSEMAVRQGTELTSGGLAIVQ